MKIVNATRKKAGYTMGLEPNGQESLVVVAKETFDFPARSGDPVVRSQQQEELVMADLFSGAPGFSAPIVESDFAPCKQRCDVLLTGSAHAPGGKPATSVQVGLRVGSCAKSFMVVGSRSWRGGLFGVSSTPPIPFTEMPISYDRAFGGADNSHPDARRHAAIQDNPVGVGFHVNLAPEALDGKPLPNTEEVETPVTKPDGAYRPMAFGPLGRGWKSRLRYAGTYDQAWLDDGFPFLPNDFDVRYHQSAPEDQQINFPTGGEDVVIVNLTPEGRTSFKLPSVELPVLFIMKDSSEMARMAVVDTLAIDATRRRLVVVWRTSMLIQRSMHEVANVIVGTMPRAWHRARETGKIWYPSLRELVGRRGMR